MFEKNEEKKATPTEEKKASPAATPTEGAPLTEEQKKAKKNEASKKMIARKKAAITILADLANRLGTPEEKKAAAYLTGAGRVAGAPREAAKDFVAILFNGEVGKTIDEGAVFKATKMGRLEMRALIKKEVNRGNWISFDANKEVYTFVAKGTEAPAGWNGPLPKAPKL